MQNFLSLIGEVDSIPCFEKRICCYYFCVAQFSSLFLPSAFVVVCFSGLDETISAIGEDNDGRIKVEAPRF